MNKSLLLVFFWAVCTTLSFGQSGTNLNRATRFAVLAANQVTNTGTTTVTGDLGISPGSTINDSGVLTVTGTRDLGNAAAAGAMEDAQAAYTALWASPSPSPLASTIGSSTTIRPGTYRISGDAELRGFLTLDARGNSDAKFIFLIDGDFSSQANAVILLVGGAQSQNIFWVVNGSSTVLGNSNVFHGTILAQGDITLSNAVSLTGRVVSLGGSVNLNSNNVVQPIQYENNLNITKTVSAGPYVLREEVTYTITAANAGPTNAVNVVVSENIPAGLTLVSATPAKGTYNQATNEWNIPVLADEESTTLTLVFRLTQPGQLTNTVEITSEYNDPDTEDNNASATITVICPALPAIVVTGNNEICDTAQEVTYTVTAVEGATYAYTLPTGWAIVSENGNTLVARPTDNGISGPISVTVTDECGNTATGAIDVVIVAVPGMPTIEGDELICDINETYTYTATGVSGDVTYEWVAGGSFVIESGQGTASVVVRATSVAEGTIAVRALNICNEPGERTERTIRVSAAPEVPVINSTADNTEVCEGSTVTYSITGVSGETYAWRLSGGIALAEGSDLAGEEITVVVSGDGALFVTATNECGTSAEGTLAVTAITIPAAPGAITGPTAVCRASSGHTYSVEEVAGVTYKWTAPAGWTFTGDGTNTIIATATEDSEAGNITVIANNKCGDSQATTFAVTLNERPVAPVITGDETACVSTTPVTYAITAVAGEAYAWTVTGDISIDGADNAAQVNVIVNGTGTLTVTATNGCGSTSTNLTITPTPVLPAPANLAHSATGEICEDQEITLTIDPVAGATDYAWDIPTDWDVRSENRTTTTLVVIAKASGTVSVVANNKCGPGAAATLNIDVTPRAAAPASITGDLTACVDAETPVTYSIAAVAGATDYIWSVTGDLEIVEGTERGLEVSILVKGTGNLTVTSVAGTCNGGSITETITPSVKPAAPGAITGEAAVCRESGNHTYSVEEVAGVTYKWTAPAGWTFTGDGTNTIIATATEDAEAGNITVIANNKCGDGPATTFAVTLKEKPAAPSITGDATACIGTPVTYSVTAVAGQTYTWRLTGGIALAEGSDLEGENVSVIISGTGSIFVSATNECGTGAEGTLEINPSTTLAAPVNLRSNVTGEICEGQQVTFNIDAVAGATDYSWNLPDGWTPSPASTTTQLIAIAGASGTVSVVANNKCGAGTAATMDVTVTPTPAAPVFTSENITPCINTSVTYSVAAASGITHIWEIDGDYTVDGDLEGDEITITLNGPVTISVSGINGTCPGPATTLSVNPTTAPAAPGAITGPSEVCAGSTGNVFTVAEVAGATNYEWNLPEGWTITAGEGTNSITVTANTAGGAITVGVSNACFPDAIVSAPFAVGISTPPAAAAAIIDNSTLCGGLTYSIAAISGATTYDWSVSEGFTISEGNGTTTIKVTRNNNNATTGTLTVIASNAGGCPGAAATFDFNTEVLNSNLDFPKAFSPNNDGNNDRWVISNLEKYPENEVTIFNRYGSEVYRMKNYQNNWDGNGLAAGTYFYKVRVRLCDGVTQDFTGYTTIFR